ncbi:subtilisin family serine protease [Streptosporangium becharense]|uniref:Subtilisin family serine protease n=1 Tax=Streptosporangium becharense TaxID=1816182 RepID=A0A7W9IJD7_9ACTN|nr:S8 family serine peptidase [Streptosporangium becharense]MBB2913963.1 subtilisin family serine protease [Streptosporangium becharense]MBB5821376.1 subtilisin family serine protease [Streptosporangium becharense]
MRLRALAAMVIAFTMAPAVPALAEEPPVLPAVTASPSPAPAPPATADPGPTTAPAENAGNPGRPAPAPAQGQEQPVPADGAPPPAQNPPPDDASASAQDPPADGAAPPADGASPPAQDPPADGATPPPAPKLETGLAADDDGARVIVELANPVEAAPVAGEAERLPDAQLVAAPPQTSFIVVEATGESLAKLAEDPRVRSIRRDRTFSPASLASGLQVVGADKAHAAGISGRGRTIAIIDTGIDGDHPDFGGKVVDEACFSATDSGAQSLCPEGKTTGPGSADAETPACVHNGVNLCDHGTHVAGIAHAVAPEAEIVAIQVFSRVNDCADEGGVCLTAYESSLLQALDHVAKLKDSRPGLVAVNLSLGGGLFEGACDAEPGLEELKARIEALRAKGVAAVAAAGNEGVAAAGAPGCLSGSVTVAATGDDDAVPSWSNHGSALDLFAPGLEIDSAAPGGGHQVYSGTSMAAPHVAGALALMAEKFPESPDALVDKLKAAGRPITYAGVTTPRLDLNAAMLGADPSPGVTHNPAPGDGSTPDDPADDPAEDPSDDPADDPSPEPSTGPSPSATPTDPEPTPVPLPTVTVTVTVTASPPPAAAPPAAVCTRGTSPKTLTAAQWAAEVARDKGTLPDATLSCYLGMVGKASKVFPELTRASTLGTAYRVLKPAKKTARAKLDSELLAAWLNWAHGGVNFTAKVGKDATLKQVLTRAEQKRLKGTTSATYTSLLKKKVNAKRAA